MPTLDTTDVNNIWAKDIDPGTTSQTAGGAMWTLMQRTGNMANNQIPAIIAQIQDIEDKVDTLISSFSALPGADLNYIKSKVDELTADPAVAGTSHPIVAAVNYAETH